MTEIMAILQETTLTVEQAAELLAIIIQRTQFRPVPLPSDQTYSNFLMHVNHLEYNVASLGEQLLEKNKEIGELRAQLIALGAKNG